MSGNQWHARLSASGTKRWATCPGSAALMERFPSNNESGQAALMGTAAHGLSERCLELGQVPENYRGRLIEIMDVGGEEGFSILRKGAKLPKDPKRVVFEVDDDMIYAVSQMVYYVNRRLVELGLISGEENTKHAVERGTLRLETRVNPLPSCEDTGGSADVTIDAWPDVLEIVDYKHGSGVFVPVNDNPQLRSYALGAALETGDPEDYEEIRYTICQPRHHETPVDGIMSESIHPKALLEWQDWLSDAVAEVGNARLCIKNLDDKYEMIGELDDFNFFNTGNSGEGCTFCDLKADCPAMRRMVQDEAAIMFDDEASPIDEPNPGANRLASTLPWIKHIRKWCDEIEMAAKIKAENGEKIPGYKLTRGTSNRKWATNLSEAAIIANVKAYGISKKELYKDPAMITGVQALKLVDKELQEGFEKSLLEKPEAPLKLVPESAKGEEVIVSPEDHYDDDTDLDF